MSKTLVIGTIVAVVGLFALGGFLLWQNVSNQVTHTPTEQQTPPPAPAPSPSAEQVPLERTGETILSVDKHIYTKEDPIVFTLTNNSSIPIVAKRGVYVAPVLFVQLEVYDKEINSWGIFSGETRAPAEGEGSFLDAKYPYKEEAVLPHGESWTSQVISFSPLKVPGPFEIKPPPGTKARLIVYYYQENERKHVSSNEFEFGFPEGALGVLARYCSSLDPIYEYVKASYVQANEDAD